MKLIWHIFLKDLRRLAVPLAVWALLLAAKFAFGWHMITWDGTEENQFKRMIGVEYLLIGLECVACFLIATRLVHEDPLVGGNAFWITRPISGARLLAAKVFGAVLMFGVLPLVMAVPWWLANHFGWAEMRSAIVESFVWQVAIVAPAVLLAVLTDGISRLLLWTLVVAAFATWWFLLAAAGAPGNNPMSVGVVWTRSCVELTIGTAMIAIAVALQYRTRRLVRSLGVVTTGVMLVGVVTQLWPWDWARALEVPIVGSLWTAPPKKTDGGITFTVTRARVPEFTVRTPDSVLPIVSVDFVAKGVPPDRSIVAGWVAQTWRWADGATMGRDASFGRWWSNNDFRDPAVSRALGLPPALDGLGGGSAFARSRVTRSLANRMSREPPAYAAEFDFVVSRPERVIEVPLRAEPRRWLGANSVRLAGPRWRGEGRSDALDLITVESRPVFTRFVATLAFLFPVKDDNSMLQYWVVNRVDHTAFASPGRYGPNIDLGAVRICWEANWFGNYHENSIGYGRNTVRLGKQSEGASLVGVSFRDPQRFQSELKLSRFEVTH